MKKSIIVASLLAVLAFPLFADAPDRDMLLTSSGVLFTAESEPAWNFPGVRADATRVISLNVQNGATSSTTIVPESLTYGVHSSPALAHDAASGTLFVFWEKAPTRMASQLVFCTYRDGRWSAPTYIDDGTFQIRRNLQLAVTRRVEVVGNDGRRSEATELTLHAVWWEETGAGETARYAMMTIENGAVSNIVIRPLASFLPFGGIWTFIGNQNRELFRHPAIFESENKATVEVLFGDVTRNSFYRVTLRPQRDAFRVRIPVGVKLRDVVPPSFAGDVEGRVSSLVSGDDMVLYFVSGSRLQYTRYEGQWSPMRTIVLSERVSATAARDALRRMIDNE